MSHSKRHDYLVLDHQAAKSDVRSDQCIIPRESLGAARMLLECVAKRRNYRLESSCDQYSNIMSLREKTSKLCSLTHEQRLPKPLDDPANIPPLPLLDRRTICHAGGCVSQSHLVDDLHQLDKSDEIPGVFTVKEILLGSGTCIIMKAPITLEKFVSDVSVIMQIAQPGACNDFATARLSLLDLEFSRYR
jgi:hypothetical protein